MSATTKEETPESSPQMTAAMSSKVDKKKLKLLKMALKDERSSRGIIEKELEAAHDSIDKLKQNITDKVLIILFSSYL